MAIARHLVREGAPAVVIAGRNAERGKAACAQLTALGTECLFVQTDVSVPDDCYRLMDTAIAKFNAISGLVNAAGIADRSTLLNTSLDEWDAHFNTNARGPFLLMQKLVAHLLATARPGSIVNIVSVAAHCGGPSVTPYSASKAALANLTKNVANAYAPNRIRCNGIMAGWMDTPGDDAVQKKYHGRVDDWQRGVEAELPMGQLAKPDQLAGLAAYMLSPDSGVMTGSLVDYDQNVLGA